MKRLWLCVVLAFGTSGCGAVVREAIKKPVSSACESKGLKGCANLTEGILLYAEGETEKANGEITKGIAANTPAQLKEFTKALKNLLKTPPLDQSAGPLLEVIAMLEGAPGAPDREVVALVEEASRPKRGRKVAATDGASTFDGQESHPAPREATPVRAVMPSPEQEALSAARLRTRTVVPSAEAGGSPCEGGMLTQTKTPCSVTRVGIGPVLVTDVQTASDCPDELFIVAGPMGAPSWYLTGRPAANLTVHGAQLVVPRDIGLGVGVRASSSVAPRRDTRCSITFTYRCLGKGGQCSGEDDMTP